MQRAYRVRLEKQAKRDLAALSSIDSARIFHAIDRYATDGQGKAKRLLGRRKGQLRLRVGRFRIFFSVVGREIVVDAVADRKDAYR